MKLNPLVLMRKEFDNKGIVFDPGNNKAMSLNAVGVVIWEAIEHGCTLEQITEIVTDKFAVDGQTAAKDIEVFLATLKSKGLLAE